MAAIAGACALPDREEFARGAADSGSGNGDASTFEAGASDASASVEGGNEAAADAGFCPRAAVYCNDFSNGAPDLGGFTKTSPGVGSLTVENGVLVAKLEALPDKGYYETIAQYELPSGALKGAIEVDMNVSSAPWNGGNMVVLGFYYTGEASNQADELYINQDTSSITTSVAGQLVYTGSEQPLPRDAWVRVKLVVDFTPHNGSFEVDYDGATAIVRSGIDFAPAGANAALVVTLGMTRNNAPTPALTTSYDNLAVFLP